MKEIDGIIIAETIEEVRLSIADGKFMVMIDNQGFSANPCIFVNKEMMKKDVAAIERLKSHTTLKNMDNPEKKYYVGILCSLVHGFVASADFFGRLKAKGFEATVKEARDGKLEKDIPVHPLP